MIRQLQLSQNAAVGVLTETMRVDHNNPVHSFLHRLPVCQRIDFKTLLFRAVQYDDISSENRETFIVSEYRLFHCDANHTFYSNIFSHLNDMMHSSTWHGCRQETCMKATQKKVEESERDTEHPTRQDKTRSSYLLLLLLLHGHGLDMKSLTRTRDPYFAYYAADRSSQQTQTPLTFFFMRIMSNSTERESTNTTHKSSVECSKQTPGSDIAKGFWLQ